MNSRGVTVCTHSEKINYICLPDSLLPAFCSKGPQRPAGSSRCLPMELEDDRRSTQVTI